MPGNIHTEMLAKHMPEKNKKRDVKGSKFKNAYARRYGSKK